MSIAQTLKTACVKYHSFFDLPALFWCDSFPGPERERGIIHSVYSTTKNSLSRTGLELTRLIWTAPNTDLGVDLAPKVRELI